MLTEICYLCWLYRSSRWSTIGIHSALNHSSSGHIIIYRNAYVALQTVCQLLQREFCSVFAQLFSVSLSGQCSYGGCIAEQFWFRQEKVNSDNFFAICAFIHHMHPSWWTNFRSTVLVCISIHLTHGMNYTSYFRAGQEISVGKPQTIHVTVQKIPWLLWFVSSQQLINYCILWSRVIRIFSFVAYWVSKKADCFDRTQLMC